MQDTLHYTLSTIPQVLAALIALLGVFWVYKVDHLNNRLKKQAEVLKREIDSEDEEKVGFIERLHRDLKEKKGYTHKDIERLSYRIDSTIHKKIISGSIIQFVIFSKYKKTQL
ncbi:hypothetical protein ED312_04600 [Sinomicrobium pectinilyticum]|uniref:Uncharacterized protein n=1 Tax=Sinomicrobium pectinilyticum TaxID=1084421 RepID=A0A3N0EUK3_SINP1|nr:hypothetical protein [Sinomicrobium pectinilyticum]RNL91454.1 hypothetical protein ED312_04600 [Sinomicrobium pectinilyticum]